MYEKTRASSLFLYFAHYQFHVPPDHNLLIRNLKFIIRNWREVPLLLPQRVMLQVYLPLKEDPGTLFERAGKVRDIEFVIAHQLIRS